MPFPRGRPVKAVLEHLDRLTSQMPRDGFTVPQIAARSDMIKNIKRIRAMLSLKFKEGRLTRVARGVYARIPGVPLTTSLPKGLVKQAVYEALRSDRKVDPWYMGEVVRFVAAYIGRPKRRVKNAANNALDALRRQGEVRRTGNRGHYRYELVTPMKVAS